MASSPRTPPHRNSVFTHSPPSSTQPEWEQYYYYATPDQPVTPGHNVRDSYLETGASAGLGMRRQRNQMYVNSPQESPAESCPYANTQPPSPVYAMPEVRNQRSPGAGSSYSSWSDSTFDSPGPGSQYASPGAGSPYPSPGARTPSGRSRQETPTNPSHRDSVFTYSPPSPSQREWEQYYYYGSPDQPVTPGHDMTESYLNAGASPSVGMRRSGGYPLDAKSSPIVISPSPSPYGSEMGEPYHSKLGQSTFHVSKLTPPAQTEAESLGISAWPSPPRSSRLEQSSTFHVSKLTPPSQTKAATLESSAFPSPPRTATKTPTPFRYPSEGMTPDDSNRPLSSSVMGRLSYTTTTPSMPSGTRSPPASFQESPSPNASRKLRSASEGSPAQDRTLTASPGRQSVRTPTSASSETQRKEFYVASPPSSAPVTTGTRRRLSYHYPLSPNAIVFPPTPPPTPPSTPPPSYEEIYGSPQTPPKQRKRLPVTSPPDFPPWEEVKSPPVIPARDKVKSPPVSPAWDEVNSPSPEKSKCSHCPTILSEYARRNLTQIPTSTPTDSQVRFGVTSIPAMPRADTSIRFYKGDRSPSIYGDNDSRASSPNELNRSFMASDRSSTSSTSTLSPQGSSRSWGWDTSGDSTLATPPRSGRPMGPKPPRKPVGVVHNLSSETFDRSVKEQQMLVVLFFNSQTNPPGIEKNWGDHSLKGPAGVEPVFSAVDCAKEKQLCAREKIMSHPFYRLYVQGTLVNAVKDFGLLNNP